MPVKMSHQEEIDKGTVIAVHPNGRWWCKVYAYDPLTKKDRSEWKSTKIKYEDGRRVNKNSARKFALALAAEIAPRIGKTENPNRKVTITELATEWKDLVSDLAQKNEDLIAQNKPPQHEIYGGRHNKYWRAARIETVAIYHRYLEEYWKTLPEQDVSKITSKHLDSFLEWAKAQTWGASQTTKLITQIRMIFLHGKSKGLTELKPSPKRPAIDLSASSRRKLQQEDFEKMFEYTRNRYQEHGISLRRRDTYLQFHCWLLICTHTGIRPPAHLKNAMKWEHYINEPVKEGDYDLRFLRRESEKDLKPYNAIILPEAFEAFDMLEELYRERAMGKPEYLFSHTHDRKESRNSPGHTKGQVILSYRKQWATMLSKLGLETKAVAQKDRLVPYSMRGYFHTKMMYEHPELRMEEIGKLTGTSERMLSVSYLDIKSDRTAKNIAASMNWGKK